MAQVNVQSYLKFLKARSTGLKQKSAAWVAARQDTIGASEIAALTGNSHFETRRSLFQKRYGQYLRMIKPPVHGALFSSLLLTKACSLMHILECASLMT